VYDDPDGNKRDSWAVIKVNKDMVVQTGSVCVLTFEKTDSYEADAVKVHSFRLPTNLFYGETNSLIDVVAGIKQLTFVKGRYILLFIL
jgi:hypothetical protein